METTREELRRRVHRAHSVSTGSGFKPKCPWCEKPVGSGAELHEWLVKRNQVPRNRQDLIMVKQNCILAHRACHQDHGQNVEFKIRSLDTACRALKAITIGPWYRDLTLALPGLKKGWLLPTKALPGHQIIRHLKAALDLHIPDHEDIIPHIDSDGMAEAIRAFKGRRARGEGIPGMNHDALVHAMIEGYWYDYLKGVCS